MNVVKVTVRPLAHTDTRYAWSIYYADIPTLAKLTEDVKAFATSSLVDMLLEVLDAAKPVMVSSTEDLSHWRTAVKVAATPVGVIDYDKVVVNSLEDFEKVHGHEVAQVAEEA